MIKGFGIDAGNECVLCPDTSQEATSPLAITVYAILGVGLIGAVVFAIMNRKVIAILADTALRAAEENEEEEEEEDTDQEEGDFSAELMEEDDKVRVTDLTIVETEEVELTPEDELEAEIAKTKFGQAHARLSSFRDSILENPKIKAAREKFAAWGKVAGKAMIKIKILITLYQLACSMDSNVSITMPAIFSTVSDEISSLTDIDVVSSVPWPCGDTASSLTFVGIFGGDATSSRFHYGHKLFTTTVMPRRPYVLLRPGGRQRA